MAPKQPKGSQSRAPASAGAGSPSRSVLQELKDLPNLYNRAIATKMYEVEEPIDLYWHRPLAALLTIFVYYCPIVITPNHITVGGLFLGWTSAWFLYETTYPTFLVPHCFTVDQAWYMASVFFFTWIVSDCSDGQVARLLKRGTRLGRIIDGTVDVLVLVPNLVIMTAIAYTRYGTWGGRITGFAAFSVAMHAGLYDQMKNTYLENSLPQTETSGESAATVYQEYLNNKKKKGCGCETALLGWYYVYLTRQELQFGGEVASRQGSVPSSVDLKDRNAYRIKYQGTMRLSSFIGISAHVCPMYITWMLIPSFPFAFHCLVFILAVPMNVLHVACALLFKYSGMQPRKR